MKRKSCCLAVLLCLCLFSTSQAQLMNKSREEKFRALFPDTEDADLQFIMNNKNLFIYTDYEMPQCYQANQGSLRGVFGVNQPIAANSDPVARNLGLNPNIGNINLDFGWRKGAGLENTNNVKSFKFLLLPTNISTGNLYPVAYYETRLPQDSGNTYQWLFPEGTIVGEVLYMTGPNKKDYVFEIRTREQTKTFWEPEVYRPFTSPAELAKAIQELRPGKNYTSSAKLVSHTVNINQPLRRVFKETAGVDFLEDLNDDELVYELLLCTPFKNVHGTPWHEDSNGLIAHAPSTKASWHIVPKDYTACMVEVSAKSCMRCHENTSLHATDFARNGTGKGLREWYGRSKGSAGVFSFHIFDKNYISNNGSSQEVRVSELLRKAGIIAKYDAKIHTGDRYRRIQEFDAATRSKPDGSLSGTVGAY